MTNAANTPDAVHLLWRVMMCICMLMHSHMESIEQGAKEAGVRRRGGEGEGGGGGGGGSCEEQRRHSPSASVRLQFRAKVRAAAREASVSTKILDWLS